MSTEATRASLTDAIQYLIEWDSLENEVPLSLFFHDGGQNVIHGLYFGYAGSGCWDDAYLMYDPRDRPHWTWPWWRGYPNAGRFAQRSHLSLELRRGVYFGFHAPRGGTASPLANARVIL